jgi:hypothetical protein
MFCWGDAKIKLDLQDVLYLLSLSYSNLFLTTNAISNKKDRTSIQVNNKGEQAVVLFDLLLCSTLVLQ